MDNLTHTLYGFALAKAGLDRTSRHATPAILIGANLPDIDLATIMGGQINYLRYHRGVTHSLFGIAIESLLLALFFMGFEKPGTHRKRLKLFFWLFLASLIGTGSHLFLDYTNSYGIRPFLPFKSEWYSLDTVFIIDPWILFFLLNRVGDDLSLQINKSGNWSSAHQPEKWGDIIIDPNFRILGYQRAFAPFGT